ncbi:MAG: hypothetical protein ABI779_09010 [Acidobacteriota bacterium]
MSALSNLAFSEEETVSDRMPKPVTVIHTGDPLEPLKASPDPLILDPGQYRITWTGPDDLSLTIIGLPVSVDNLSCDWDNTLTGGQRPQSFAYTISALQNPPREGVAPISFDPVIENDPPRPDDGDSDLAG